MAQRIISDLQDFGATSEQLVDIASETSARVLPYLDMSRDSLAPVAVESLGQTRGFVLDGARLDAPEIGRWIRKVAFRGDADWLGVVTPGRLDVYAAELSGNSPIRVENLGPGEFLLPSLLHRPAGRRTNVRNALLRLLRRSITQARNHGVPPRDALSLVGRAVFWRFLVDRDLLNGLHPHSIVPTATTWENCLDNKRNALRTFEWLDETFNGGLLPFGESPSRIEASVFRTVVGNIAHAAMADGQLELRLPSEWREVNFAHVPVGLLSEVYEAYAHDYTAAARAQSIFYTPRSIAQFVVDEALAGIENAKPRVLDPSCGAGVFLLTAYRALVKREWGRTGRRPDRAVLRRILSDQLVGFDINLDALRLAELGLYLTAIELDPEKHPRPLSRLRFNGLRPNVLRLKDEETGGSLGPVEEEFVEQFDLVVGNPPWTASATAAEKNNWLRDTRGLDERLGAEVAAKFDFSDTGPDLPFVFRAMEWAKPGGVIALVTHARWLFWQTRKGVRLRAALFQALHVTGILNGTSLRDTDVWPNVRHPFCLLFAVNRPSPSRAAFHFISPELDHSPDKTQRHMRVDWTQSRELLVEDVLRQPCTLKTSFRGNAIDEVVLEKVRKIGKPASEYFAAFNVRLRNGYIRGTGNQASRPTPSYLRSVPDLRGVSPGWIINAPSLPPLSEPFLLRPRPAELYRAPLLLLRESVLANPRAPRASVALEDVAYDDRFDGVSFHGTPEGAEIARYLQLVFQSSLVTHFFLMTDAQFGIEREVIHKESIGNLPIVPWEKLSKKQRSRALDVSRRLWADGDSLQEEIDDFVANVFELSDIERDAIRDALSVALPSARAKASATRATTTAERESFAEILRDEVSDMLATPVSVSLADAGGENPWRFLVAALGHRPPTAVLSQADRRKSVELADDGAASLLMVRHERFLTLGQLNRYRFWTRTRARVLAGQVAESLGDA